jgi:hypothetical protein
MGMFTHAPLRITIEETETYTSEEPSWTTPRRTMTALHRVLLLALLGLAVTVSCQDAGTCQDASAGDRPPKPSTQRQNAAVDNFCLVRHCSWHLARCALSSSCRRATNCYTGAGSDWVKSTLCGLMYPDQTINDILTCVIKHNCSSLEWLAPITPPRSWFNVTYEDLAGDWRRVAGFDPALDCVPCYRATFGSSGTLTGDFYFPEHQRRIVYQNKLRYHDGRVTTEAITVQLDDGSIMPIWYEGWTEDLYFLYYDGTYALMHNINFFPILGWYHGVGVLARRPGAILIDVQQKMAAVLQERGILWQDMCVYPAESLQCPF